MQHRTGLLLLSGGRLCALASFVTAPPSLRGFASAWNAEARHSSRHDLVEYMSLGTFRIDEGERGGRGAGGR